MIHNKTVISIIPARGGSKGLPKKNILPLLNHPLIAYSIEASLKCQYIDRTIVSTDSEEIATIATKYGAEVPFMRPVAYADDLSRDIEAFIHALNWLASEEKYVPDIIVQLRPTSPVRFSADIAYGIELLAGNEGADSLRAVTPSPITPFKMWWVPDATQTMQPLLHVDDIAEPFNEPRQNLPQTYWQTGTLDIMKRETLLEKKSMTGSRILPFIMDNKYAVDIDDISSFARAEKVIMESNCIKFHD